MKLQSKVTILALITIGAIFTLYSLSEKAPIKNQTFPTKIKTRIDKSITKEVKVVSFIDMNLSDTLVLAAEKKDITEQDLKLFKNSIYSDPEKDAKINNFLEEFLYEGNNTNNP